MTAKRWMQELETSEKVRSSMLAKEKKSAAEQEATMLAAEKRAWIRELERTDSDGFCTLTSNDRVKMAYRIHDMVCELGVHGLKEIQVFLRDLIEKK